MTLATRMNELNRAGFSGIWISSHEHQDAIVELAAMARDETWQLATWNIDRGLRAVGNVSVTAEANDPLAVSRVAAATPPDDGTTIYVLENFHRFLGSAEIVQALIHAVVLGNEVGRPVLILDVGSLMGSLVGQSEERTRQALATINAMAPCVLTIDEVEKAFAGATGGSNGDSGVSSRTFGSFLSWLNDHESDVFVVCTANDIQKLSPEFVRAERFDAVFFLEQEQGKGELIPRPVQELSLSER